MLSDLILKAPRLGWILSKSIYRINVLYFRFCLPRIRKKLSNQVINHFSNKKALGKRLSDVLGDFSSNSDYVDSAEKNRIISAADSILEGCYDILGSGPTLLKPINWHLDFKSGRQWKRGTFYKDYQQIDLEDSSDVKVPRELSRGPHLLILGQAFLLSGDEKYVREVVNQLDNWIDENPLMHSINWGCAMDVAIRAVNWLYALNMIASSPYLNDAYCQKLAVSLFEHGFYIFNNLEKSFKFSNNHYMSNLSGLIYLGIFFEGTTEGLKWKSYAIPEFFSEIRYQIFPSGVSYEMSVSYHRLMTELVFYSYLYLKRNNIYIPLDVRYRIKSMFEYVLNYTKPNGKAPIIGDQDDGRFVPLGINHNLDHRYLLNLASVEYNEARFRKNAVSGETEIYFLLGYNALIKQRNSDTSESRLISTVYPDSGFCVLRSPYFYVFISNSGAPSYPDQLEKWGSHSHADMLSFELNFAGKDVIVDSGTYVYSADPVMRNLFRSSRMHNTLIVDKINQQGYPENNIFKCDRVSRPLDFIFKSGENSDTIIGSHDAYLLLKDPVKHTRKFELLKHPQQLIIKDTIECVERHHYAWYFHFDRGLIFDFTDDKIIFHIDNRILKMKIEFPEKPIMRKINDFVSKSYGTREDSITIEYSLERKGSFTATIIFEVLQNL